MGPSRLALCTQDILLLLSISLVAASGALPIVPHSSQNDALSPLKAIVNDAGASCLLVHEAAIQAAAHGATEAGASLGNLVARVPQILESLENADHGSLYAPLFGDASQALQVAVDVAQLLSLAAMTKKDCFSSTARLTLGQALMPLHAALRQQVSTMWWMFDIGQYSNTNSPAKHFQAILRTIRQVETMFDHLVTSLPGALARKTHFWGHSEHGMFVNSTVMYRRLFPESAIVDKGLLRCVLRILPRDSTVADFGALDGQYARWLNDTGWVTAFAFDGVEGVSELTEGSVTRADLVDVLSIPWYQEPFYWILCLEVAEHIPADHEQAFLANLARYARHGLILSWAPPGIEGEGHVNCLPLDESQRRMEMWGFTQDTQATALLRGASHVPWISASVAVYRRTDQ